MLALASAAPACLITEPVAFDDTQMATHLSNPRPFTFTRVPGAPDMVCGTASNGPYMAFTVDVSDGNLNEQLLAKLIVNGRFATDIDIPATGNVARAPVVLCATKIELSAQCNRVELVVSSDFEPGRNPYATVDPNDFAKVEWWVLGPAESAPNANQNECTRWADGGVQ